ncbi:unnamed protein product [Rotaria sp. Silwood1]|nr:unnamed protein product [Rotaria sp. Silwood1]CAF1546386.1 unnamed protein product [Rotaria sp. Silwood1]
MGTKLSKQENNFSSSHDKTSYGEYVIRSYAKWNHCSVLVSHDPSRFTTHEILNLNKHNEICQNSTNSIIKNPRLIIQNQSLSIEKVKFHSSSRDKSHYDHSKDEKNLKLKKSQSSDHLSHSNNIITAKQLIKFHQHRIIEKRQDLTQSSDEIFLNKYIEKSPSKTNKNQFIFSNNKKEKIPADLQFVLINQYDLQNAHEIGKGHFGTVYHALYKGTRDVAVKTLNSRRKDRPNGDKSSIEEYDDNIYELLNEAYIMTGLQHINLLRIIGVTFFGKEQQLGLVTDFMKNGSLLDYLRKSRNIFLKLNSKDVKFKLNSFAKQIFQAMLFLEQRSIIHRDLATRNCLIGDDDTVKVADFGLTKLTECGLYKGSYRTICAIRWTSPEAIFHSEYTSRSDVWSYGITLWEIYSLGERPFASMNNIAIKNILKNQLVNICFYLPRSYQYISDETYNQIIRPCLTYNVILRPRFSDLIERIQKILH